MDPNAHTSSSLLSDVISENMSVNSVVLGVVEGGISLVHVGAFIFPALGDKVSGHLKDGMTVEIIQGTRRPTACLHGHLGVWTPRRFLRVLSITTWTIFGSGEHQLI